MAYPIVTHKTKYEKKSSLSKNVEIRQVKYLNNIIEQYHRLLSG